jgi:2-polyprenyl-3-methyl-5-hydroxy-6-metoxy-1,4-benzoquinol methylase
MPLISQPPGKYFKGEFQTFHRINIIQFLESWTEHIRGEVLDVGVGTWTFPRDLLSTRCHYISVDNYSHENADMVCSIYDLKNTVQLEFYDYVLCTDVIEHLTKPWIALQSIHSVLKTGGKLLLTTPFFYRLHPNEISPDCWRITEQGLNVILTEIAGFREVQIHSVGHPRLPYTLTAVATK